MTGAATREAALEPLRAALLTRAGKDADLMRRAAEDDGRKALTAAQERSRQSLANARARVRQRRHCWRPRSVLARAARREALSSPRNGKRMKSYAGRSVTRSANCSLILNGRTD